MKCKKLTSMVFALVMALTLALPALASAENGGTNFSATAVTMLPTIDVDIDKTQSPILLNPFNFVIPDEDDKTPTEIDAPNIHVKNRTLTDLQVSAVIIGAVSGAVTFSSSPLTKTVTAKKAFVYGVFQVQEDEDYELDDPGYDRSATNQVVIKASTLNKKNIIRLPAASPEEPNYLSFGVFGNCTTNPKIAWTAADTLSVSVAYSFRMTPIAAS